MKKIFTKIIKYNVSIERTFIDEHIEFSENLYDVIENALETQNKRIIDYQFLLIDENLKRGLLRELVVYYNQHPKESSEYYDYLITEINNYKQEQNWQVKSKIICQKLKKRLVEINWTMLELQHKTNWSDKTIQLIEEEKLYFTSGTLYKLRELLHEDYSYDWDKNNDYQI
jgi:hypothetical protein